MLGCGAFLSIVARLCLSYPISDVKKSCKCTNTTNAPIPVWFWLVGRTIWLNLESLKGKMFRHCIQCSSLWWLQCFWPINVYSFIWSGNNFVVTKTISVFSISSSHWYSNGVDTVTFFIYVWYFWRYFSSYPSGFIVIYMFLWVSEHGWAAKRC